MAAETMVASIVGMLTQGALNQVMDELKKLYGVEEEVGKLERTLPLLRGMLRDAEERQLAGETAVEEWLKGLKDLAREVDDVLDEFSTRAALRRLKKEAKEEESDEESEAEVGDDGRSPRRGGQRPPAGRASSVFFSMVTACSSWCFGLFSPSEIPDRHEIAIKIDGITGKMEELKQQGEFLKLVSDSSRGGSSVGANSLRRPETSSVPVEELFGRDEDKKRIIERLFAVSDHDDAEGSDASSTAGGARVAMVPIVGIGGTGKTTLVQEVFNDDSVKTWFTIKKWLFVGEHFNANTMIQSILGDTTHGVRTLDDLHGELMHMLENKRFLLVLDDVWCDQPTQWEQLWAPLARGGLGSKVVVTTRNTVVAEAMGPVDIYQLQKLSDDACWSILRKHAFPKGDAARHPRLLNIGQKNVPKLKGMPLVAKIVGSMLAGTKEERQWRRILEDKLWASQKQGEDLIEQVVGLSYRYLPAHLKQCFAYCALFPKDFRFHKTTLVQMWMAQGFVFADESGDRMEDVGADYFDHLLHRSFFQCVQGEYVMHDIVHDLAQSVSNAECWAMGEKKRKPPEKPCHLSFSCTKPESVAIVDWSDKFPTLRSLVHSCDIRILTFHHLREEELFSKIKCIRVLDLKCCSVKRLPDCIADLIHLRYLDLTTTKIAKLPESISNLYNLQTLKLDRGCTLPKGTSNLVNLRCLEADSGLVAEVPRIGRLTSLQELKVFKVRKERGHRISELAGMAQLRGGLCMQGLHNVDGGREKAAEARLHDKRDLESLELEWGASGDDHGGDTLHDSVLEGLHPHIDLKKVKISGHPGTRAPTWLGTGALSILVSIHLHNCKTWTVLPPLGALHSLEFLTLEGMTSVRAIRHEFYGDLKEGTAFPSLKELVFSDMSAWDEWLGPKDGESCFPSLIRLDMRRCPELRAMPPLSCSLTQLTVEDMGFGAPPDETDVATFALQRVTSLATLLRSHRSCLENLIIGDYVEEIENMLCEAGTLSSLKTLVLRGCSTLTSWPEVGYNCLTSLSELELARLPHLRSLPAVALRHLKVVRSLKILDCPELLSVGLDGLESAFLEELFVCSPRCTFTEQGSVLPAASTLRIFYTSIRSILQWLLPQRLTSLTHILICDCAELTSFSPEEEEGLRNLTSLVDFRLHRCHNVISVPSGLRDLPFLRKMELADCFQCRLPDSGLPVALRDLYIGGSRVLKWQVRQEKYKDKYSHVQHIYSDH